jgi:hypothetical protein
MGAVGITAEAILVEQATVPTDAALPIVPGMAIAAAHHEVSRAAGCAAGTASMAEADSGAAVGADSMAEVDFTVAEATVADTAKA